MLKDKIISQNSGFATRFLRRSLFVLILFAISSTTKADLTIIQNLQSFDLDSPIPAEEVKLFISGNRIRFDQGQKMSSIILKDKKVTFSIMHETRQYIALPHALATSGDDKTVGDALESLQIEKTGKTEQIHGFLCKQLKVKEKDGSISELWIADAAIDVNNFYKEFQNFMQFGLGDVTKQLEKYPDLKGIPIRVTEFQGVKKLRESTIMRLETAKIPDSTFEVPAGYSEIKIPSTRD
jgi:hypothetical protein